MFICFCFLLSAKMIGSKDFPHYFSSFSVKRSLKIPFLNIRTEVGEFVLLWDLPKTMTFFALLAFHHLSSIELSLRSYINYCYVFMTICNNLMSVCQLMPYTVMSPGFNPSFTLRLVPCTPRAFHAWCILFHWSRKSLAPRVNLKL